MDIKDNSSSDNCLWLINAMKQYNSESDVSLYNWKRYNSKDDFNVIIKSFNVEEKTEQVKNETNNPKTGDNITTSVILFVASISTIGTLIVINRKKVRE